MPLVLQYNAQTAVPVEIEGLVPNAVRDKPLAEIERLEIFHGNQKLPLAEFFSVSGDPGDGRIRPTNAQFPTWVNNLPPDELARMETLGESVMNAIRGLSAAMYVKF